MNEPAASSGPIAVLIADSSRMQSQLLTSALRRRSEFSVASCDMEAVSIVRAVGAKRPSVALLSLAVSTAVSQAVDTLRSFHFYHPEIPKVLLADACDREMVVSAFHAGARGVFAITNADMRLLYRCLVRVAAGQIWANTEQLNYLVDTIAEVPSLRVFSSTGGSLLTPREEQVVALVAEGLGNREIARELNLSEHTIKKYVFRVFEKLGVSSRVELVLYALNNGAPRTAEWLAGNVRGMPAA